MKKQNKKPVTVYILIFFILFLAISGLYCRIFIEGLFGIRPTGLRKFMCTPSLPGDWNRMALRRVNAFGRVWDIEVVRDKKKLRVRITDAAKTVIYEKSLPPGQPHQVRLVSAAGCYKNHKASSLPDSY